MYKALIPLVFTISLAFAQGFINPIIPGFNPDPSITRKGDDFYLATSSFEYFPGVPIYHSKDLVHWTLIGHALHRESQLDLSKAQSSQGIYAPTIRYDSLTDKFYMTTTNVYEWNHGGDNFYVTADDPAGPWSDPIIVRPPGEDKDWWYDPDLYFEGDKVYYSREEGTAFDGVIVLAEIDINTGEMKEKPQLIWGNEGYRWPEGNHIYKKDGTYYCVRAEGGTGQGHMMTIAKADNIYGPYEKHPNHYILTHSSDKNPGAEDSIIQSVGHGEIFQAPNGEWWSVFLGTRHVGGPPGGSGKYGKHHIGRETFMAPVDWSGTWPVVYDNQFISTSMPTAPDLPKGDFVPPRALEPFTNSHLSPHWSYIRNPDSSNYSLTERKGWLRLYGSSDDLDKDFASPTFVGKRQQGFDVKVQTKIDYDPKEGEFAGLSIRVAEVSYVHLHVFKEGGKRKVGLKGKLAYDQNFPESSYDINDDGPIILEFTADTSHVFWQAYNSEGTPFGFADSIAIGDNLGQEGVGQKQNGNSFTGLYYGLFSYSTESSPSPADFDWFYYKDEMPFTSNIGLDSAVHTIGEFSFGIGFADYRSDNDKNSSFKNYIDANVSINDHSTYFWDLTVNNVEDNDMLKYFIQNPSSGTFKFNMEHYKEKAGNTVEIHVNDNLQATYDANDQSTDNEISMPSGQNTVSLVFKGDYDPEFEFFGFTFERTGDTSSDSFSSSTESSSSDDTISSSSEIQITSIKSEITSRDTFRISYHNGIHFSHIQIQPHQKMTIRNLNGKLIQHSISTNEISNLKSGIYIIQLHEE